MKTLIVACLCFIAVPRSHAALGPYVYDGIAATSATVDSVTIASVTATLFSPTSLSQTLGDGHAATWFSVEAFNVGTSSIAFTYFNSATTAPTISCANNVIIGSGTEVAPATRVFKVSNMWVWMRNCTNGASATVGRVILGR